MLLQSFAMYFNFYLETADTDGLTAAAIAGIVIAILLLIGLVALAIWYFCWWRNRDDHLKHDMTQRAGNLLLLNFLKHRN